MKYYLIGLLGCLTLCTAVYAQDEVSITDSTSDVLSSDIKSNEPLTKAEKLQQNTLNLKQKLAERKAKLQQRSNEITVKAKTKKQKIIKKDISADKKEKPMDTVGASSESLTSKVETTINKTEQKEIKALNVGQSVIDGDYVAFQLIATPKMLQMINTKAKFDKLVTAYRVLVSTQASKNNDKASIKPSGENKPIVPATTDSQPKSSTSSDNDKTVKSSSTSAADSNDLPSQNTKIYTPAELAQAAQVERSDGPVEMKKVQTKRGYWIMVPVE